MKRQFLFGCLFIALAAVIFSTMEVLLKLPAVAGAFHLCRSRWSGSWWGGSVCSLWRGGPCGGRGFA
ncbi:MAG: hypothetical protein ACLT9P_04470 [Evtepia gabavorous]